MARSRSLNRISNLLACLCFIPALTSGSNVNNNGVRDGLHFSLESRATNKDGSVPIYKDPTASIEARVADLLPRMTIEEKVSQMYVVRTDGVPTY
jgi:beta-glucosidase